MFLFHYRKIAALFIVLTGLSIALFFFTDHNNSPKNGPITLNSKNQNNPSLEFTKNYLNKGLNYQGGTAQNSFSNLTEAAAEAYLAEIIGRNPNGPNLKDQKQTLNLPSEEALSEVIQNYLNQDFRWTTFKIKDLNISADSSKTARLKYLESIKSVIEKKKKNLELELIALNDFFGNKNSDGLKKVTISLQEQVDELLKMSAPAANGSFHLEVVNAWQYQAAIYEAVLELEDDPLRALLAINEVSANAQEFQDINLTAQKEYEALKS